MSPHDAETALKVLIPLAAGLELAGLWILHRARHGRRP